MVERWIVGTLDCWGVGVLECRCIWCIEMLKWRSMGWVCRSDGSKLSDCRCEELVRFWNGAEDLVDSLVTGLAFLSSYRWDREGGSSELKATFAKTFAGM